jgi:hypothetical protein
MKHYLKAVLLCGSTAMLLLLLGSYFEGEKTRLGQWFDIRVFSCLLFTLFFLIEAKRQRFVRGKSIVLLLVLPMAYTIAWLIVSVPALISFHLWLGRPL